MTVVARRVGETEGQQPERVRALHALSPLDGRYRGQVEPLAAHFSEAGLVRARMRVEAEYFLALLGELGISVVAAERDAVRAAYLDLGHGELLSIKDREAVLGHDVKAVEYALKERVGRTALAPHVEKVHLGLTSEDVNNLAWSLVHGEALQGPLWSGLRQVMERLGDLVSQHRDTPMLGRTHGQPATPTTLGKELGVFLHRLAREAAGLRETRLPGKLNGATGTYGAFVVAYPRVDWPAFSRRFVTDFGLEFNPVTTQIEPHDGLAALYDRLRRVGSILQGLCQDIWHYVSDGYFRQRVAPGEVGSSAMPHKVNPVDFENAEGNLGVAGALFAHLSDKLTRSRLQRDLSDSTVLRNAGVACGHLYLALLAVRRGLGKLEADTEALAADLAAHPEVLAEAYQSVLRAEGHPAPYEALKDLTRGRAVTLADLRAFLGGLDVSPEARARLQDLSPRTYLGLAPQVADEALEAARRLLSSGPGAGVSAGPQEAPE